MSDLRAAQTESEIVAATARALWAKHHNGEDCPIGHIPSEAELREWLTGEDWPTAAPLVNFGGEKYKWVPIALGDSTPQLCLVSVEGTNNAIFCRDLETVHRAWCDTPLDPHSPHPLAPLVEAWQRRPRQVKTYRKQHSVVPLVLKATQLHPQDTPQDDRYDQLPLVASLDPVGQWSYQSQQAKLPFLERSRPSQLVSALPVQLYNRAGGVLQTKGRGSPISLRLFFEALMSIPLQDRSEHTSAELVVTLRDLVTWIWPNGWERRRNLPMLAWALKDLGELRIEWERRLWNLVVARTLPTWETKLTDPIVFHVFSLPSSDRGPLIDRFQLRHWGLQSASAYRAYLRLAYLWDDVKSKRGNYRVYATRPKVLRDKHGYLIDAKGKPILEKGRRITDWNHRRAIRTGEIERNPAADAVPQLGPDDLAALGFDDNPSLTRQQIADRACQTRRALKQMEAAGAVVLETDRHGGLRILEPAPPAKK